MERKSKLRMSGGKEFQRRGAEQLKALDPMVVKQEEGTMSLMEEDDLRVQEGVLMCTVLFLAVCIQLGNITNI